MAKQCYSELECKIIKAQIERRAKFRKEFLKLRTDPCKHSQEAGYVFDESMQRFLTMKCYQFHYFSPGVSTAIKGVAILAPMFVFGYLFYNDRTKQEEAYRCGKIKYRDRMFKFQ